VQGRAVQRLGRPELAPLVDELARRFEAGDTPVSVTLRDLPDPSRRALADLMGADRRPRPTSRMSVQKLVAVLGLGSADELRDAVEGLRGPLTNRRAAKIEAQAARQALWSWLGAEAGGVGLGGSGARLASWVDDQRAVGARGGVETHRRRLESALAVLRRLPSEGTSLASLANDATGDPHALDYGRTLSGMVLHAVAYAFENPKAVDAEAARSLWEMVGVVPDPHSSTVLALGVRGDERTALGRWLSACAKVGEPAVLSLAQLRRWPILPAPVDGCVYVVENPSIIAEACPARDGPPLVCSSGRPTIATVTLLRQLAAKGATVHQHADFDPTGLAITAWLADRIGSVPWKMTAADYVASISPAAPEFLGEPPETPWDPELQPVMSKHRRALYEEEIRFQLLQSILTYRR
jgi:uncharacterized protein (TIGR02679 family)